MPSPSVPARRGNPHRTGLARTAHRLTQAFPPLFARQSRQSLLPAVPGSSPLGVVGQYVREPPRLQRPNSTSGGRGHAPPLRHN